MNRKFITSYGRVGVDSFQKLKSTTKQINLSTDSQFPLQLLLKRPPFNSLTYVRFNSRYWLHCHSNLMVSRTKILNLKWQIRRHINHISREKFVTFKILEVYKNCKSRYWLQICFLPNVIWLYDKCYVINISPDLSCKILNLCPRNP